MSKPMLAATLLVVITGAMLVTLEIADHNQWEAKGDLQRELDDRLVRAAESAANAEWQQVYWLKQQTELMETPCCMCQ